MQKTSLQRLVGQTIGQYRCELFLGKSRLHTIYQVRHITTQQIAALVLTPIPTSMSPIARQRFFARFHQEAASIKAFHHSNIVPLYDHGDIFDTPYIVIPATKNRSILDYFLQLGYHDHAAISTLLPQAAAGLSYAHDRGIVHGSLRPSMLVFNDHDQIQIAGFGFLRMFQADLEQNLQTSAHLLSIAGTLLVAPSYVAPELVIGQAIEARADVYSLACIIFELLTGIPPFSGENALAVAQMHVTHPVPFAHDLNPTIPLVVSSVVQQAMEREPAQRFKHIDEFCEAFVQASQGALTSTQKQRTYQDVQQTGSKRTSTHDADQLTLPSDPADSTDPFDLSTASQKLTVVADKLISSKKPSVSPQKIVSQTQATLPGILESDAGNNDKLIAQDIKKRWQLQPPLVSEKLAAVRRPAQASPITSNKSQTIPSITPPAVQQRTTMLRNETGDLHEAYTEMFSSTPTPTPTYRLPDTPRIINNQSPSLRLPPPPQPVDNSNFTPFSTINSQSTHQQADTPSPSPDGTEQQLMQNFAWWSQENSAPPAHIHTEQTPASRTSAPSANNFLADPWTMDAFQQSPSSSKKKNRAHSPKRRQVVALLATGGLLVAAGAVTALDLTHKGLPTPNTAPQKAQTNAPQTKSTAPGTVNHSTTIQPAQGKSIGTTNQTLNTSVAFANPTDGQASLLIHLSDGTFVAAERACTHQGVAVNYHPDTQKLVCPLHGSVFDPANNFKVLQGPATLPLKPVTIKVNTNGTITTV